jgi:DNA-directed RNA polymerase
MYTEHDVLQEILDKARKNLTGAKGAKSLERAPLPEKGLLDLKEVLKAGYAFA